MIKSGIEYAKARSILLNQGYKPKKVCNADATIPALCKSYPEIEACSGGSESCKMIFRSPNGQDIEVFTSSSLPRYGKQTKDAVFYCVQQSESQTCFN